MRELPTRAVVALVLLIAVRTGGALLLAQAIADGIARIAAGGVPTPASTALGAAGILVQALAAWTLRIVATRTAAAVKSRLRARGAGALVAGAPGEPARTAIAIGPGLDDLDELLVTAIPSAIAAVVVPVMVLGRVLVADPLSGLIVAVTLPLIPLFLALVGLHSRDRTAAALEALHRLAHHVVELASGLPVLVGLGRLREQTAALADVQDRVRRRTRETLRTAFLSSLALELVATISVALVAVVLGVRLSEHTVPLSVALLVLVVAPDAFAALGDAGAAYHASQKGSEALAAVRGVVAPSARPFDPDAGLALWDARVRRGDDLVLGPIDLDVRPGELVAITGPSGCGKSTLLAAVAGIPTPDVTITGIVARSARVGYAPQEVRTLAQDVAGELALVSPDAAAARRVAVELGIDGLLGAASAELSPGERRRLGVARALLRADAGAHLLLLDEPTAHLDAASAELVNAALLVRRRGAALVVVTHSPTLLALADRIVTIAPRTHASSETLGSRSAAARRTTTRLETSPVSPEPDTARGAVPATPAPAASPLRQLLAAAPARWAAAILLGLLATGAGIALSGLSGWLIVRAAEGAPILLLLPAIVGVRFFGLGRAAARYAERLQTHDALFTATDRMRLRIWDAIAARSAGSRRLQEGGTALDRLVTGIESVREAAPRVLVPIPAGVLAVAGISIAVALLAPAALPAAAVLLLTVIVAPLLAAAGAARAEARRVHLRSVLARESAALVGAGPELAANGAGPAALRRITDLGARSAEAERRGAAGLGLGEAVLRLGVGAAALLVLQGAGAAGAATVAAAALLLLAAADPLGALSSAAPRVAGLRASLNGLASFLTPTGAAAEPRTRSVRDLRLEGLAARWPGAAEPVFRGLDARVRRGEWLAVLGPSGSGKTTLLTVLLGGLPPDAGRVLVDGEPLATARPRFAWCPQDAHVFDSTLRGNLLLAGPATDDALAAALERVGLGPLLREPAQPHAGLDMRVGTGGRALSGGERRRLAVARALLTRADVLLLDEPTAHLDEVAADALIDDLRRATRDRIVVLVTHREADLRPDDHRIRLGVDRPGRMVAPAPIEAPSATSIGAPVRTR
jgi:ATP-binding cassette subfamily C protein CydCD